MPNIPLKRGMLIKHQNHVFVVTDFHEQHTGRQHSTVHVALRDIRDGRAVDRTLNELQPIEEVEHAYRQMQYLYAKDPLHVFMESQTFEEYELEERHLRGGAQFLVTGNEYRVMFLEGRPVSLELPEIVSLKVAMTAAPGHSVGAASNITKEATLENGLEVRVPLFIKTGDTIRVDTRTKAYAGKES
ncbi:MAG TPA: elongation factor P [Phycisphaerae bacterium]|jgi:elongation factor P